MAELVVAGHRLEIERLAGAAGRPTLVFLHEGLGARSAWRGFPAALAAATGCPALVYSRRGYGRSAPAPGPWPITFMHDEALHLLPALLAAAAVDDAVLVGHSDGASIALIYTAAVGARVRGLVLLAPHVFVEDVTVASIAALRAPAAAAALRQRLARHHDHPDALFAAWTGVWLDPAFRAWNLEELLPRVRVPALVIQGADDEYGTAAQVDAVGRGLGARCERLILPACGHAPHRDQPAATVAAAAAFVARLG